MPKWQILLIVAGIIVAGCIAGVIVGKHLVKRAQGKRMSVLSPKQRIIFFSCIAIGVGCILTGIYLESRPPAGMEGMMEGEMGLGGGYAGGVPSPKADVATYRSAGAATAVFVADSTTVTVMDDGVEVETVIASEDTEEPTEE